MNEMWNMKKSLLFAIALVAVILISMNMASADEKKTITPQGKQRTLRPIACIWYGHRCQEACWGHWEPVLQCPERHGRASNTSYNRVSLDGKTGRQEAPDHGVQGLISSSKVSLHARHTRSPREQRWEMAHSSPATTLPPDTRPSVVCRFFKKKK